VEEKEDDEENIEVLIPENSLSKGQLRRQRIQKKNYTTNKSLKKKKKKPNDKGKLFWKRKSRKLFFLLKKQEREQKSPKIKEDGKFRKQRNQ